MCYDVQCINYCCMPIMHAGCCICINGKLKHMHTGCTGCMACTSKAANHLVLPLHTMGGAHPKGIENGVCIRRHAVCNSWTNARMVTVVKKMKKECTIPSKMPVLCVENSRNYYQIVISHLYLQPKTKKVAEAITCMETSGVLLLMNNLVQRGTF